MNTPVLPPAGTRVVVAMSGGVDSSVVAALCAEAGCETIGVTLQLYDHGEAARPGACCAGADIRDARAVAARLGIAHYVLDYASAFQASVIDEFADSYARGQTPVPCVTCNRTVKFRDLLGVAKDLGADCLATGHYVRRTDGPQLWRGVDPGKDQSYFLYATTLEQLDYLRFPLGGLSKAAVRAHATRLGLAVATKPDSQDICFVPGGDYAGIVARLRPEAVQPGEIVDLDGRVLGEHPGLINFTVGQRRGIGVGGVAEPLYAVRLEPAARRLVVGPRAALAVSGATLDAINWLGDGDPAGDIAVKVRSMALPVPARLDGGGLSFAAPEYGVSPGQAAVFYDGDRVLGGGTIVATQSAMLAAHARQIPDAVNALTPQTVSATSPLVATTL